MDKRYIENFLRLNGISLAANEREMRDALRAAEWQTDDIEIAMDRVRQPEDRWSDEHREGARNIFFTDMSVPPETLSSLLGLTVSVDNYQKEQAEKNSFRSQMFKVVTIFLIVIVSVALGVLSTFFFMYMAEIGPFYSPIENYTF